MKELIEKIECIDSEIINLNSKFKEGIDEIKEGLNKLDELLDNVKTELLNLRNKLNEESKSDL